MHSVLNSLVVTCMGNILQILSSLKKLLFKVFRLNFPQKKTPTDLHTFFKLIVSLLIVALFLIYNEIVFVLFLYFSQY